MSIARTIKRYLAGKTKLEQTLSTVLCRLGPYGDTFTVREACQGLLCFGEIGSGKSCLMNSLFLESFLRCGMNGIISVVKSGEGAEIARIAKACGREKDLIVFNEETNLSFSLLEYVLNRKDSSAKEITNLSNLLMRIYRITKSYRENSQTGSNDHYWEDSLESLIQFIIQLLILAKEPVNIINMQQVILDLLTEDELKRYNTIWADLNNPHIPAERQDEIWTDYMKWANSNAFLRAFQKVNERNDLAEDEMQMLKQVGDFFLKIFPKLSEKTTSVIVQSFITLTQPFQSGMLRKHFTEGVSDELRPENCFENNKIIIIDFPVKSWGLPGIYAASICKEAFQLAAERRIIDDDSAGKASFIWIDEAHHLLTNNDTSFQLTARSKNIACVYITQTLPSIKATLGESAGQERVKSLVSNLGLKIFLANSCTDTNSWASKLIGQYRAETVSSVIGGDRSGSRTYSETLRDIVPPEEFAKLRTGGPPQYKIEAIMFKAGKKWKSGENFNRVIFDQKIKR
ncbi:MAG: TraM recognition domain-containing protein [Flavipsychrobacter sp.]|nr:TraM recognition domain-containing protein [Flavipsychrobacter sp.]